MYFLNKKGVMIAKFALFSFFLLNFFSISPASAQIGTSNQELESQTGAFIGSSGFNPATTEQSLSAIVALVIKTFLGLLGIIFLVLLVIAGFRYMTAAGNEEQTSKAIDTIKQAIIGLIIVILAYSITYFVFNNLPLMGGGGANVTEY